MSDVNAEMKETAEYARKSAKNRYNLDLDYSEQSIAALDSILEKMYWGFSSRIDDKGKDGLVYNTAIIWGSYLGEYMRLKWGGSWKLKGNQQVITIKNRDFSPISFVYQKITGHFNYKLEDYLFETNQIVGPVEKAIKQEQYIQSYSEALEKKIATPREKKPFFSRRNIIIAGSVGGFLVVASIFIIVFTNLSSGGFPAFGSGPVTDTPTKTSTELAIIIPTETQIIPPSPTITPLPTYTSQPSRTPRPSSTPYMSPTPLPTFTPTQTETPIPTDTAIPYRSPTPTRTRTPTPRPPQPTATSVPPTDTQPPPPPPPPTNTQPPPAILSCSVSPSSVAPGQQTTLKFTVQFSAPGYGMSISGFDPSGIPGQQGCSDNNTDGDSTASCNGQSGYVPPGTKVNVVIQTPLGNCSTSYQAQ